MAAFQHSTLASSRRNFLSGAALAPVALAIPATAIAAPGSAWDAAVRRVNETKAANDAFAAARMTPANNAFDAGRITYAQIHAVENEGADISGNHSDAVNSMTLIPAPTIAALHWKIATADADYLFDGEEVSRSAIKAILADLARLAGAA